MKNKLLNKKGQFFSILIVLVIIGISIFFSYKVQISEKEDEFHMERLQLVVMDNFVREFDNYYLRHILTTAAKPALEGRIREYKEAFEKFDKKELEGVMKTGGGVIREELTTESMYKQAIATLSFGLPDESTDFNYTLKEISQPAYNKIRLEFEANYAFSVFGSVWSEEDKVIVIDFELYSIMHPGYSGRVISEDWVKGGEGCFTKDVFTDAKPCSVANIKPDINDEL